MVIIYIDDGYFQGDKPAMDQMIEQLRAEGIKLKVEDSMEDYLSCQVLFSKDGKRGWLGQPHMVKKLLNSFGDDIQGLRKTKTPGTPSLILTLITLSISLKASGVPLSMHLVNSLTALAMSGLECLTK